MHRFWTILAIISLHVLPLITLAFLGCTTSDPLVFGTATSTSSSAATSSSSSAMGEGGAGASGGMGGQGNGSAGIGGSMASAGGSFADAGPDTCECNGKPYGSVCGPDGLGACYNHMGPWHCYFYCIDDAGYAVGTYTQCPNPCPGMGYGNYNPH